jgi:transposase
MDVKSKQRAVMEFLLVEGCAGDEIAARLQNMYGEDAYCRASMFRWIQEIGRGSEELRNEGRPGRPCRHEADAAIGSILQDEPSASLRTIAETSAISPETVRTHMARIGYTLRALRIWSKAAAYNARVTENFLKHNPLKRLPNPPYSPDISPSDFYLFGKVKKALIGQEISDKIDLLEVVTEILTGISHDELQAVFRSWVERVQAVIDADGDYVSW